MIPTERSFLCDDFVYTYRYGFVPELVELTPKMFTVRIFIDSTVCQLVE